MLKIIEVLGVSWSTANLIYDYLEGSAWWALTIDAGFLVAGLITGGIAAFIRKAVKLGLKQAIKGLTKRAAIML